MEGLPWVRSASVERMLPDTVLVSVEERRPLALWQHKGQFRLIDQAGDVINIERLDQFGHLLVVVGDGKSGDGAPGAAPGLLKVLETQPHMMARVKAAQWVGERRWNLRMEGDIDVRLPEIGAVDAWERDVQVLDLRLPDRLIVQTKGDKTKIERVSAKKT